MIKQIGLFGFGCVAQGFYEGLLQNPQFGVSIKKICVKSDSKKRNAPQALFTTSDLDILEDPEIDVIIELIDDAAAALHIARYSLKNNIPVISANKKMIAENLAELVVLQQQYETPMLYEGAVAGSIPILQNLAQFFSHQKISLVRGILNGSTNYMLTKMKNQHISFAQALKEAQGLGFAETDPTLDVKGLDATYKSIILAFHAFGEIVSVNDVEIVGIDKLTSALLLQGRRTGKKIKLITEISKSTGILKITVKPELIGEQDSLYAIDYEYNAIEVSGNLSGTQTYVGKGAGSLPTGSAILNDLYLLLNNFQYSHQKQSAQKKTA